MLIPGKAQLSRICLLLSLTSVMGFPVNTSGVQEAAVSASPIQGAPLIWHQVLRLHDGRTFVSDGRFTLDAALAKPAVLPSHVLQEATAKLVEGYLTAELPDKFDIGQLTRNGENYTAPDGILL